MHALRIMIWFCFIIISSYYIQIKLQKMPPWQQSHHHQQHQLEQQPTPINSFADAFANVGANLWDVPLPPPQQIHPHKPASPDDTPHPILSPKEASPPPLVQQQQQMLSEQYHGTLCELMQWSDGIHYPCHRSFSWEQLLQVTADDVYWCQSLGSLVILMQMKEQSFQGSTISILFWRGREPLVTSCQNNNIPLNDVAQIGNPTCSPAMSWLTRAMRHFQTELSGVASKIRRPLMHKEYKSIIESLWKLQNKELRLCGAAFFTFHFSMIGRVDDAAKFWEADLKAYPPFPDYGNTARPPWSKNCHWWERCTSASLVWCRWCKIHHTF